MLCAVAIDVRSSTPSCRVGEYQSLEQRRPVERRGNVGIASGECVLKCRIQRAPKREAGNRKAEIAFLKHTMSEIFKKTGVSQHLYLQGVLFHLHFLSERSFECLRQPLSQLGRPIGRAHSVRWHRLIGLW